MFAPRSLRRSTSAPGRGAERGAETLGRSSPARGRKSVEPEVKALAKEPQIRSCATADGKLDATSDSVVVEKSEGLRKTLSCSAKGILTRTRDVSPITSPAPPQITPPTLYAALGHAASRTLLRETSGPLPPYTMSVPTAPVTMPLNAILSPPVPYPARPSGAMVAPTTTRVFYPRVQPPANSIHHPPVKPLKFQAHQHPPPQQAMCSRRTVVWQPGPGGPTLLQSKPVAMPPLRVLHCKVVPPKTFDGTSSVPVPTELSADKEPEPEKDPAEVEAEEKMAKEMARFEREEQARCDLCEAVVDATQLEVSMTDLLTLRQARTKLLDALAAAQREELPRSERSLAEQQRRRLHNALQDMKGQLRVSCRIRPLSVKEKAQQSDHAVYALDSSHVAIVLPELDTPRVFEFDSVFRPDCSQQVMEEIFDDCRDLVQSAVDGHNVTVMTYGQTGAGKTYTLFGNKHQEGLAQYMIREVFARLGDQEGEVSEHPKVTVCGSALELYNNHFIDLLRPIDRTGRQSPGVKVCVDSEGCVQVDGLAQLPASEPSELLQILRKGLAQRVVAEHAMNADSSRSHMVFTVRLNVEGCEKPRKLTFCDLGGCERLKRTQVAGDLQKEAIEINKSLSALSSVIEAVAGRRRHVPYRDHKLTNLLRDAVGGTAKVLMYVCCSPAASNLEETAAALKLASRAAKVVNQREANEPAPEE